MKLRWFYRGDIDGFFGLFIDNLLQLMLISVLCQFVAGLPADLVSGRILPGAAFSILFGNLFYAWQAKGLAESTHRPQTTALPYGINTISLFAHIFLIMAPVYRATQNPELAWKAGLFACFGSALIELFGAFFGDWLRRHTPRAALLTALAGIALTFISMGFVFQIFAKPSLALIPAFLILFVYASRVKLPLGIPGGLAALIVGSSIAWIARAWGFELFQPNSDPYHFALHLPQSNIGELWDFISKEDGWRYLSIIFPMGLFNVIGSLQNLESAEAAGDRYPTRSSLLANGLGGLAAALLGSPFPTTIYIGHPGWKAMGARWGYSILNGLVISALCLFGGVSLILRIVPIEAMIGILLWIGLVIAAQAYRDVPRHHYIGVAFGFIPTLAAWLLLEIETTLRVVGTDLNSNVTKFGEQIYIQGVMALSQGFIITSMIFAAIMIFVVELKFKNAALWCLAAAALSFFGIIHAYELSDLGVQSHFAINAAPSFTCAYLGLALILLWLQRFGKFENQDGSWAQAWKLADSPKGIEGLELRGKEIKSKIKPRKRR
jgi:AGZA family xanthine/uracil permease-like MFS transporter